MIGIIRKNIKFHKRNIQSNKNNKFITKKRWFLSILAKAIILKITVLILIKDQIVQLEKLQKIIRLVLIHLKNVLLIFIANS